MKPFASYCVLCALDKRPLFLSSVKRYLVSTDIVLKAAQFFFLLFFYYAINSIDIIWLETESSQILKTTRWLYL